MDAHSSFTVVFPVCLVEDIADLKVMISDMIGKETIVLVKASRALQLDKVTTYLKAVA